jgi:endoglucanase
MMRRLLLAAALFTPGTVSASHRPAAVGDGFWHTSGSDVLDAQGAVVHWSGVNWSGFETPNRVLHGLWGNVDGQGHSRSLGSYLDQMQTLGLNLIRLPFSGDLFVPGQMPASGTIDFTANPSLQGKTCLEIMDLMVSECGTRGIRIILDYHRIHGGSASEAGLWYIPGDATSTEQYWIENWKALVGRYLADSTVVGCDLFNEIHGDASHPGPFWDADGVNEPYNWRTAAIRCGNAILSVNPKLLICVQGMDHFGAETSWWGANWEAIATIPIALSTANQLVYEIHDYGPDVFVQPWHNDPTFPNNLPGFWDKQWGFIAKQGIGPVWVGEWGSKLDVTREIQWATSLHDYIKTHTLSWTWWTWSPLSSDTGGILQNDFTNVNQNKLNLVHDVQYPAFASSGGGSPPPPPPPPPPGASPYGGSPAPIPGTIQAENYDLGGEGVGYHNTDPVNHFGQYRSDGVSIEATLDVSGGYDVGWITPGEWLQYTVDVATAGTYSVDFRVASATSGGTMHLSSGVTNLTGTVSAPSTGGWQTWQTVTAPGVTLSSGTQALRLVFDSGSFNVNSMTFTSTSPAPAPPPSGGGGSGTSKPKGGGGGGGGCGLTGLEAAALLGLLVLRRRRTEIAI